MKGFNAFGLAVLMLLISAIVKAGDVPILPFPSIVQEGGSEVKILWRKLGKGTLLKVLPHDLFHAQRDWSYFLGHDAERIAINFFYERFQGNSEAALNNGLKYFLNKLQSQEERFVFPPEGYTHFRELAQILVLNFADQRAYKREALAREMYLKREAELLANLQKSIDSSIMTQRRITEARDAARDAERKEWGKTLSLAPDAGPSSNN